MKKSLFIAILLCGHVIFAQKYKSTSGTIKFFSEELLENITAINSRVSSVFDEETGQIVFSLPITGFEFEKALMGEHFNEKYLESEKFPKSTFKARIMGYTRGQMNPEVWADGELEIHGVKQNIKVKGQLNYLKKEIKLYAVFTVKLADYNITIPELLFQKIAEEIEITIDIDYKPYEN